MHADKIDRSGQVGMARYCFAFWVGIVSSVMVIIMVSAERLLPLNWRGLLLLDLFLNTLGKLAYTVFIPALLIVIFIFFVAVVRLLARKSRTDGLSLWVPFLCQVLAAAFFLSLPVKVGYPEWRQDYHQVALMIENGRLAAGAEKRLILLPAPYKRLTLSGDVMAVRKGERLAVFFPVDRSFGYFQRWIIYISDDKKPSAVEITGSDVCQSVLRKLDDRWYDMVIY